MYEYKMIQMSRRVADSASSYLQEIANDHAAEGWEFFRVDPFSVVTSHKSGCLSAIGLGRTEYRTSNVYVATFRRTREEGSEQVEAEDAEESSTD